MHYIFCILVLNYIAWNFAIIIYFITIYLCAIFNIFISEIFIRSNATIPTKAIGERKCFKFNRVDHMYASCSVGTYCLCVWSMYVLIQACHIMCGILYMTVYRFVGYRTDTCTGYWRVTKCVELWISSHTPNAHQSLAILAKGLINNVIINTHWSKQNVEWWL